MEFLRIKGMASGINKAKLSETDIITKFILPAVKGAGWDDRKQIRQEFPITDGKVVVRGQVAARQKARRADIALFYKDGKTDQPIPDAIAKQSQQLQNNKSITFAPTIHLTPTGTPSYDQQLSDKVIERLQAEFAQGMMGNMDVATRADGSLTDKRGS